VARPRLTGLLDATDAQAIVLCAPAGYGKSVLAAEWLEGKQAGWYAALPAAADLAAFAVGLAQSAATVVPAAGRRLAERARLPEAPAEATEALAELLADDLAGWPDDAWLVVEDYHLVAESPAVEAFVGRVIALAPVRLLVTTRRRPAWATSRRVLYGEVVDLGRDELAMTPDEAAEVVGVRAPAVAELLERAHGWPAVVGLAALVSTKTIPRARVAATLFRYVADEVLRHEPPEVQSLMLAAAVPPRVDGRVARDVLGVPGPGAYLDRLEEEALLVPAADGTLRFHPLVREFLLRTLELEDPDRWAELHDRAIADATAGGRIDEAFELAVGAGRLETAAEILAASASDLLGSGRVETVERWLAALGDAGAEDPSIRLARAEVLLRRGELFGAAALAEQVAAALPPGDPRASAAWLHAGRALQLLSEDARGLECYLAGVDAAADPRELVTALRSAVGLAAQLDDERLEELVDRLEAAAADDLDARLQVVPARVFLASRRDSLAPLWQLAVPLVEREREVRSPTTRTSFLRAAAYLAVARGDYAHGHELAERALQVCDEFRLGRVKRAFCLCSQAAADIGRRQLGRAEAALDELPSLAIEHTHVLVAERQNLRTKLLLARGDLEQVLAEVDNGDDAPAGEHRALVALAAAATGDVARARGEAAAARRSSSLIEARFYAQFALVVARLAEEGPTSAVQLEAVGLVERAAGAEILDALVIAYRACPPLLELLSGDASCAALLHGLLARAGDHALGRRSGIRLPGGVPFEAGMAGLTPRENEVLSLMAQGLGNRDIARRLFISEKTTKVHIGHIFEKLGVESRVQAVLAAKELPEARPARPTAL